MTGSECLPDAAAAGRWRAGAKSYELVAWGTSYRPSGLASDVGLMIGRRQMREGANVESGGWAERWERRRLQQQAELEAAPHGNALPSLITLALMCLGGFVFVGVVGGAPAGPGLGLAQMVRHVADWYIGIFRGHLWNVPSTSAADATSPVLVGPAAVVLGVSSVGVGLAIAVVSAGPVGVLLGLLLAASGLSRVLHAVRPRGRPKAS